jgi:ABC-2 type transport system permease protein
VNLWTLELARLTRTYRWMLLFGVYAFFAVLGPLSARYLNEIIGQFGGDVTIIVPDPRPVDGIAQFIGNVAQLGLLAVAVVAAGALAVDARPEVAAFLRTKVTRARDLLLPRYAVSAGAAIAALLVSTAIAWAMTHAMLGSLHAGAMLVGTLYGALYLAFAVAVVAAVAGFLRSQVATVFGSLAALLLLPLVALIEPVRPWLPSELLAAIGALLEGAPAGDFTRAVLTTLIVTPGLLALAASRFARREL